MSATIANTQPWTTPRISSRTLRRAASVVLWLVQAAPAALFLFAGGYKLVVPIATMAQQMPVALPGGFIRFIGVMEALGGLGLLLPGIFRIRPALTPLAAAGLAVVMAGAVGFTLGSGTPGAGMPGTVGILALVVAFGRSTIAPHGSR